MWSCLLVWCIMFFKKNSSCAVNKWNVMSHPTGCTIRGNNRFGYHLLKWIYFLEKPCLHLCTSVRVLSITAYQRGGRAILELLCGTFPELSNLFYILLPSVPPCLPEHRITHSILNSDVCFANVLLLKLDVSSGTSTHWLHFLATKEIVFLLSPAYQSRKISP